MENRAYAIAAGLFTLLLGAAVLQRPPKENG